MLGKKNMIFKLELSPQNFHYDVLHPLYSDQNTSVCIHWAGLDKIWVLSRECVKGQQISESNFKAFIWTKNERKYFCNTALPSKMGQIIKITAHYHANNNGYLSSI